MRPILGTILALSGTFSGVPALAQEFNTKENSELEPSSLAANKNLALGAETTPVDPVEKLTLEAPSSHRFALYFGMDFATKYISRGLIYRDEFSYQPWAELDVALARENDLPDPFSRVSWFIGNWNSFDQGDEAVGPTRTGQFALQDEWYEADLYTGLRVQLWDHVQASLRFNWYTSPSDAFKQIQELDLRITFDDREFWAERRGLEQFAITPSLRIAKETRDSAGPDQWYIQTSITPSWTFNGIPLNPRVKIPLIFGFGFNGQYQEPVSGDERHFGFFQTGLGIDLPLNQDGTITLSGGLNVVVLADSDLATCDIPAEPAEDETMARSLMDEAMSRMPMMTDTLPAPNTDPLPEELAFCQEQVELSGRFGIGFSF